MLRKLVSDMFAGLTTQKTSFRVEAMLITNGATVRLEQEIDKLALSTGPSSQINANGG